MELGLEEGIQQSRELLEHRVGREQHSREAGSGLKGMPHPARALTLLDL